MITKAVMQHKRFSVQKPVLFPLGSDPLSAHWVVCWWLLVSFADNLHPWWWQQCLWIWHLSSWRLHLLYPLSNKCKRIRQNFPHLAFSIQKDSLFYFYWLKLRYPLVLYLYVLQVLLKEVMTSSCFRCRLLQTPLLMISKTKKDSCQFGLLLL